MLAFPTNVDVEASLTYGPGPAAAAPGQAPAGTATIVMHWSMIALPDLGLSSDGVHPNAAGSRVLATAVLRSVEAACGDDLT